MENIISYILSAFSQLCSFLTTSLDELRCVLRDTLLYDLNCDLTDHYRPLYAAIGSLVIPIVMINIIYTVCCSRSHSCYQKGSDRQYRPKLEYLYEALRWFRQAEYDLQAAKYDLDQDEPASEWSCFKCQQAAEKGVKSVLISLGLTNSSAQGHNLFDLASTSQDKQLIKMSSNLQGVFGHVGRMRYPDQLPYPKVPHDVYSKMNAENSIGLTESLLNHVKDNYLKSPHIDDKKK